MKKILQLIVTMMISLSTIVFANEGSLYSDQHYRSLVADINAFRIGDNLTLLIVESAKAAANADASTSNSIGLGGGFNKLGRNEFLSTDFNVSNDGENSTNRQGVLSASISSTVMEIDSNGRMRVEGKQEITINGEKQHITIAGWIRQVDISPDNTVLSTRLSEAVIRYSGADPNTINKGRDLFKKVGNAVIWLPKKMISFGKWLVDFL